MPAATPARSARARVGGMINEYRLVAWHGRGSPHAQPVGRPSAV